VKYFKLFPQNCGLPRKPNLPKIIRKIFLSLKGKYNGKCKCNAIPLEAWRGPEGSRRLRLQDLKTVGT
jgi:hypothetical protein